MLPCPPPVCPQSVGFVEGEEEGEEEEEVCLARGGRGTGGPPLLNVWVGGGKGKRDRGERGGDEGILDGRGQKIGGGNRGSWRGKAWGI